MREEAASGIPTPFVPAVAVRLKKGRDPERTSLTLTSKVEDGWTLRGELTFRSGRVRLSSLTFFPPKDDDTALALRRLRRMGLSEVHALWERMLRFHWMDLPDEWRAGMLDTARPGRRGWPLGFYADWVRRYVDACDRSDTPVELLVNEHPGETKAAIHRYLAAAEKRGLIADRPGRGKAGGRMTDKCQRVLAGEED